MNNLIVDTLEDTLTKSKIHIRVQKRTNRKFKTMIEGLSEDLNFKEIAKKLRTKLCCNGWISQDKENKFLVFQGDHRNEIKNYLMEKININEEDIIIHGY